MMKLFTLLSLFLLLFLLIVFQVCTNTRRQSSNQMEQQNTLFSSDTTKNSLEAKDALAQMKITFSVDDFLFCAEHGKTDAVKLFLDAGMKPDAVLYKGNFTALRLAAGEGHLETVQALLAKGADVNAKDQLNRTALMEASYNGYTTIVKVLLANGADVHVKSFSGWTALGSAHHGNQDIIKLLKDAGAKE